MLPCAALLTEDAIAIIVLEAAYALDERVVLVVLRMLLQCLQLHRDPLIPRPTKATVFRKQTHPSHSNEEAYRY